VGVFPYLLTALEGTYCALQPCGDAGACWHHTVRSGVNGSKGSSHTHQFWGPKKIEPPNASDVGLEYNCARGNGRPGAIKQRGFLPGSVREKPDEGEAVESKRHGHLHWTVEGGRKRPLVEKTSKNWRCTLHFVGVKTTPESQAHGIQTNMPTDRNLASYRKRRNQIEGAARFKVECFVQRPTWK